MQTVHEGHALKRASAEKRQDAVIASFEWWAKIVGLAPTAVREVVEVLLKNLALEKLQPQDQLAVGIAAPLTSIVLSFLDTGSHLRVARCSKELRKRGGAASSWPLRVELRAPPDSSLAPLPLLQAAAPRIRELSIDVPPPAWSHDEEPELPPSSVHASFFAQFASLDVLRLRVLRVDGAAVELPVRHLLTQTVDLGRLQLPKLISAQGASLEELGDWLAGFECLGLQQLLGRGPATDSVALATLRSLPRLRALAVRSNHVRIATIADVAPSLTELTFAEQTGAGVWRREPQTALSALPRLRRLQLQGVSELDRHLPQILAEATQLEALSVEFLDPHLLGGKLPECFSMAPLAALTRLAALHIARATVLLHEVDGLGKFPALTQLALEWSDERVLSKVAALPALKRLSLSHARIPRDQIAKLGKARLLQELSLPGLVVFGTAVSSGSDKPQAMQDGHGEDVVQQRASSSRRTYASAAEATAAAVAEIGRALAVEKPALLVHSRELLFPSDYPLPPAEWRSYM